MRGCRLRLGSKLPKQRRNITDHRIGGAKKCRKIVQKKLIAASMCGRLFMQVCAGVYIGRSYERQPLVGGILCPGACCFFVRRHFCYHSVSRAPFRLRSSVSRGAIFMP